MPDWVKRVGKERGDDLHPGEIIDGASYFQGRGSAMGQIAFGAIRGLGGGVAGLAVADAARKKGLTSGKAGFNTFEGSIAAGIPDDKGVLAITSERLIVFTFSQGVLKTKIGDPVVSVPRQDLTGWSYRPGKLTSVVNLAFSDGSDVGIELPRINKPDAFADGLGIPRLD